MAKRSRARVTHEPAAATATPRTQRTRPRRPVRRSADQPLFDRYRSLIIGGLALAGVLVIGFLFFQGATRAAYECAELLTPGPSEPVPTAPPATATPAESPSPTAGESPSPTAGESPSPSPTAGESPSPSPTAGESPSPSPTAGESPSPAPTAGESPSPSPTAAPSPTPRLGFPTTDLGAFHVADAGVTIRYDYCPPASGEHYSIAGVAPMPPAVYPPAQERSPGFWVHNLEHGYVVALYRCPSGQLGVGDCISEEEFRELEAFYAAAPKPPLSTCPVKVMAARFDQMTTDFALVAWDRVLLLDEFDVDTAVTFAEQWMENVYVPEPGVC